MRSDKYAPGLGMGYRYRDGKLVFPDGVSYTVAEAVYLAQRKASPDEQKEIHAIKKAFDGEVIVPEVNDYQMRKMRPSWKADRTYPPSVDILLKSLPNPRVRKCKVVKKEVVLDANQLSLF